MNVFCKCGKLKSIIIPESVKVISNSAFQECENLQSIFLPDSIEYVDSCAFVMCRNLKSISCNKKIVEYVEIATRNI